MKRNRRQEMGRGRGNRETKEEFVVVVVVVFVVALDKAKSGKDNNDFNVKWDHFSLVK
jgi:hypothetical protein